MSDVVIHPTCLIFTDDQVLFSISLHQIPFNAVQAGETSTVIKAGG